MEIIRRNKAELTAPAEPEPPEENVAEMEEQAGYEAEYAPEKE